jgi:acyl-CoA synthetase (AMP-forming)/AMP-acid ligase II
MNCRTPIPTPQSGGAYLHPQTAAALEERFGCRVVSAYGATDGSS